MVLTGYWEVGDEKCITGLRLVDVYRILAAGPNLFGLLSDGCIDIESVVRIGSEN